MFTKFRFAAPLAVLAIYILPIVVFADVAPPPPPPSGVTITVPDDITIEATSSTGAFVTFTVTATDDTDGSVTATCDPSSESTFALGTTLVTCTASNSSFSTTTATFNVDVVDTTPPDITPPADQTFSTSTIPASPALTPATATDLVDASPSITSDAPASFPVGTTTVTWTATDASGNSVATTSQVGVFLGIETTVDVPASCDATDTDGVVHSYVASSSDTYIAMCALEAAIENGAVSDVQLSNAFPSIGLFVTQLNGVTADSNSQYWALYQNGSFANFGLSQLPITTGDTLVLQLHDFSDNNLGSQITLHVNSLVGTTTAPVSSNPAPSGGGGGGISHTSFNVSAALSYLSSKQNPDGSFASSMLTDWAALAFAASDPGTAKTNLKNYLLTASPSLSAVTDYERHALALMALGINPYSGTPTDYISPIVSAFDGTQIGNASLDNDDIFALFPLLRAGYTSSDDIIQKTVAFIIAAQQSNGSWDASPDVTAAAVQALSPVASLPGVSAALTNAKSYLHTQQQNNGGFGSGQGNSFSTSWALQAIAAFGEQQSAWAPIGYYPTDYLGGLQQSDGGVEPRSTDAQTRIWATEYAIPGALGKTWDSLLTSFAKPAAAGSGGNVATAVATSTSATSTVLIATSTPQTATTTPLTATSTLPTATSTTPIATTTVPITQPTTQTPVVARATSVTPAPAPSISPAAATTSDATTTSSQVAAAATASGSSNALDYVALVSLLLMLAGVSVWVRRGRG